MNEFTVALDPSLGLSAETLAAAWNADPETRAVGRAETASSTPGTFFDPATTLLIGAVSGIVINLVSSAIYDLLKKRLLPDKRPVVVVVKNSDGTEIIAVTLDKS